ncbi:MAG: hypothetical protein ACFFDN_03950 [Candidatus Hodarchaeota archaeon]
MDGQTSRYINILIAYPFSVVFCIILGILVLRKDKKYWGNRFFALTFWFFGMGLTFTIIYLFSNNYFLIAFLNLLSISIVNIGAFTLLLGILVIYKGEDEIIEGNLRYFFIIIIIIVNLFRALIPQGIRVELNVPIWSIIFGIYEIIIGETLFAIILYFSLILYKELSQDMKKKFKFFILGVIFVDITVLGVIINNMHIIQGFEVIRNILNAGAFIGAILIYFGIIKR